MKISNVLRMLRYDRHIFLGITLLTVFALPAYAQYCGGSVRTIVLEYPKGSEPARSVSYQLFYLMPKKKADRRWDQQRAMIAEFLYGSPEKDVSWGRSGDETFLTVPAKKAEEYINNYRVEDFAYLYDDGWHKWEPDLLVGKFDDGVLRLQTGETNSTTFIMRVTARGFETQYLLSDFLGGCHRERDKNGKPAGQKIIMKPLAAKR